MSELLSKVLDLMRFNAGQVTTLGVSWIISVPSRGAWFLRGAAYGDLGDSPNAVSDVATAVALDPSLDRYISSKGKTATLTLPPL
jgi:hypothetical protein